MFATANSSPDKAIEADMPATVRAPSLAAWQVVYNKLTQPKLLPMTDAESLHLYAAQRTDVPFEGGHLAVWHWGAGASLGTARSTQPRVLLVHGWESRATHWQAWVPALIDAGFQVSAVDLPAHGHSWSAVNVSTDVVQFGRAVLAAAQAIGPLHAVVGHSMGSAACLYAFAHGLSVQGSVHLSGPSSLTRVLQYAARAHGLDADNTNALLAAFSQRIGQPLSNMDLSALAPGLRHPGLIFHDRQDAEMPIGESIKLAAQWQQARLIEPVGVGHRRILRSAAVIEDSVSAMRAWLR